MADTFALKAILSAVDHLTPTLKAVQQQAAAARKYLGDVGASINGLTSKFGVPLGIISTIAAGFGVAAIKKAVVDFADLAEVLQKGALKAGMSVEQFQRMKYVAEQADVPIEALEMSLGKLNKNLFAAGSGKNADLVDLFKTLHIPLRGANGELRNAADMLPQVAEAFAKNKSPVLQAAMGTAMFGKSYQEMLPLLNDGSEGMAESLARFEKLKGVISPDDIKGAKAFGDKLKDLNIVTKGFQMTIAKELVPVLTPLVNNLTLWWAANKKIVGSEVKKVVQELVAAIKQVDWGVFVKGVRDAIDSIRGAVASVGGLKNALIILAVVMNAQTIAAIVGMGGALLRLGWVAGVAVFSQVGLLATANGWLATSFVWLRAQAIAAFLAIRIGGISSLAAGAWAAFSGVVASAGAALMAAGRAALLFGRALLLSPLGIVLAIAAAAWLIYENWDTLKAWFNTALSWLGDKLTWVSDAASNLLGGAAKLVTDQWEIARAWFVGLFDWLGGKFEWVTGLAGKVGSSVAGLFGPGTPGASTVQSVTAGTVAAPASRPGTPGSGSFGLNAADAANVSNFRLNAPVASNVGGSVTVSFKDAPPGMRVEQTQASNPRVPIRTDVGYRFSAAMGY